MNKGLSVKVQFLRIVEIAQALNVSRSKAYEMIASGEIPSVDIAGCKRVPVPAFEVYVDAKMKDGTR
jgi:excisionase family DNA binding protein